MNTSVFRRSLRRRPGTLINVFKRPANLAQVIIAPFEIQIQKQISKVEHVTVTGASRG